MPNLPRLLPAVAVLVVLATAAPAQSRAGAASDTVPVQLLPPAGKCRIWMSGVPAAQQPAPTDCATALRQRPANGIVLYGPAARETGRERFDPRVGVSPASRRRAEELERERQERPVPRTTPGSRGDTPERVPSTRGSRDAAGDRTPATRRAPEQSPGAGSAPRQEPKPAPSKPPAEARRKPE